MMRDSGANWTLALAAVLLALLLSGCGGAFGGPKRGTAQVRLGLETVQAGTESHPTRQIEVTLSASGADSLHQLACRVEYNPQALRYTGAERGELVTPTAVFFTTAKGEGYVPVAFTYSSGESIPAGSGSVATLSFEVLDSSADTGLRLVTDEEYLIARDSAKRSIPLRVSGAVR